MHKLQRVLALALLALVALERPALAVVTSNTRTQTIVGTGASLYSITFGFDDVTWISVRKQTIATGVSVPLTQGVDYTVRLPSSTTLGTVSTTVAVTSSYRLLVTRIVPPTQLTRFAAAGTYTALDHEKALDKLTYLYQQCVAGAAVDSNITTAIETHSAAADPHTGYHLLVGRAGGQYATGGTAAGENLTLRSTSNAVTKGKILFGTSGYNELNNRLGLGTNAPATTLDVRGDVDVQQSLVLSGSAGVGQVELTGPGTLHLRADAGFVDDTQLILTGDAGATLRVEAPDGLTIEDRTTLGVYYLHVDENGFTLPATGYIDLENTAGTSGTIVGGDTNGDDLTLMSSAGTKGNIFFGTSTYDEANNRMGIGTNVPTRTLEVRGTLAAKHYNFDFGVAATLNADTQCDAAAMSSTNNGVLTLPAIIASIYGCEVTVFADALAGAAKISISPDASDAITGTCNGVTFNTTINKDAINTLATSQKGDSMTLVAVLGKYWYIKGCTGVWAKEP